MPVAVEVPVVLAAACIPGRRLAGGGLLHLFLTRRLVRSGHVRGLGGPAGFAGRRFVAGERRRFLLRFRVVDHDQQMQCWIVRQPRHPGRNTAFAAGHHALDEAVLLARDLGDEVGKRLVVETDVLEAVAGGDDLPRRIDDRGEMPFFREPFDGAGGAFRRAQRLRQRCRLAQQQRRLPVRQGDAGCLERDDAARHAAGDPDRHGAVVSDRRETGDAGDLAARDGAEPRCCAHDRLDVGEAEQPCAGAIGPDHLVEIGRQDHQCVAGR